MLCPCKSEKEYVQCCEPFIIGNQFPETPEQLMRSRYTAYTQANIDYIIATMKGAALKDFAHQSGLYGDKVEFEKIQADLQTGKLNLSIIYPVLSLLKQKAGAQSLS